MGEWSVGTGKGGSDWGEEEKQVSKEIHGGAAKTQDHLSGLWRPTTVEASQNTYIYEHNLNVIFK